MAKKELKYPNKSGNGKNSPVIGMNGYNLKPGDNTKIVMQTLEVMNLPDIDMHSVEAVAQRLGEYFEIMAKYDTKPTVAGMAMSLNGMNRNTLRAIAKDLPTGGSGYTTALPTEVASLIKKAYDSMEVLWESYMSSGKLNPVTGIFLAKNNYGYQDKVEHVVTPNIQTDEYDAEDIKERYILDSNE